MVSIIIILFDSSVQHCLCRAEKSAHWVIRHRDELRQGRGTSGDQPPRQGPLEADTSTNNIATSGASISGGYCRAVPTRAEKPEARKKENDNHYPPAANCEFGGTIDDGLCNGRNALRLVLQIGVHAKDDLVLGHRESEED